MESTEIDIDDLLRRRYWLRQNFEWFMDEVTFHKEMKEYFSNDIRFELWHYGQLEGKVQVYADPEG